MRQEPTALGLNIARLRKAKGLTQQDLIAKCGRASIAMIEVGRRSAPRPETLEAIARALSVTVADLFVEPRPAPRRRKAG